MDEKTNPKYLEIKTYLLSLISEHFGDETYKLPSELALARMFNVSRITTKHAIDLLEKDNLITRKKGSGTYIKSNSIYTHDNIKKNKTIGLLIPDLKSKFTTSIVHGVEGVLKANNYTMLLAITEYSQELEESIISQLLELNVGGFLIYPSDNQIYNTAILKLIFNKFPIVFIDRILPGISINNVSSAHTHDCMNIVKYLVDIGHRKIGIISTAPEGTTTIQRRLRGYERGLLSNNLPIENRLMCTTLAHYDKNWETVIAEYIQKNKDMTAIIASCSDIGYKLLKLANKLSIRIPEDMSIILYDEEYTDILQFMNINPTRLEQDPYQIGASAAKLLLECIQKPADKPKSIRVPASFVVGNTTRSLL